MRTNSLVASIRAQSFKVSVLLLIGVLLLVSSCAGSRDTASPEEMEDFLELREMVENREFQIENQWAMPLSGNMINLIGNPNIIKFKGDSVQVHLPYFGVRYSGGGYGSEGGIKFNGIPQDLSVEEDKSEGRITVEFEGKHENENINFFIRLYPNGTANTSVNTTQRSGISYRGEIVSLLNSSQEDE